MEVTKSERLGTRMIVIMRLAFDAFATSSQTVLRGCT